MTSATNSILELQEQLSSSSDPATEIVDLAAACLAKANRNASHNTYLWRDEEWTLREAQHAPSMPASAPLRGIPVSVKDCFDLAGSPTSCGTKFYRDLNGIAQHDSWFVAHLRAAGAVITGKTHLHPLAYGITGENPDFGDCLQPGNPGALTGGSSSGAAASVMEGSAFAAIGTDTGGSIRVPAALCGLAGYRASHGRPATLDAWRGGAHLAPSFDTFGWLFRHLEDGPLLGAIFGPTGFGPTDATGLKLPSKFAVIAPAFLHDCESEVATSLMQCREELDALGLSSTTIDIDWWQDSIEIFAAIQASEAAEIHHGHFASIHPAFRQRLEYGASLTQSEIDALRQRHATFRARMDDLLDLHELLLMPAAPVSRLAAGADHSQTRMRLLRYTTPVSLAGMPAVTIPCFQDQQPSGGMQLVAAREDDARLLAIAAQVGAHRDSSADNLS